MADSDNTGRRTVPKHIDKSERAGEILLVFAFVFFIVRIPIVLMIKDPNGSEIGYLMLGGIAAAYLYYKATDGKKPGFLLHYGYRVGLTVRGLLPHGLKRVVK